MERKGLTFPKHRLLGGNPVAMEDFFSGTRFSFRNKIILAKVRGRRK